MQFDAKFAIRLYPAEGQPDITPEAVAAVLERHFGLRDKAFVTEGLPKVLVAIRSGDESPVIAVDGRIDLQMLDMRTLEAGDDVDDLLSRSVEVAGARENYERNLTHVRELHGAEWGEQEADGPGPR
jgi:hypothetical protein